MGTLACVILIGSASSTTADVPSPLQEACFKRAAGDSCRVDGRAGRCADSTCRRIRYVPGEGPKGTIETPCLVCTADGTPGADVPPPTPPLDPRTNPMVAAGAIVLAGGVVFAYLWHRRRHGHRSPR